MRFHVVGVGSIGTLLSFHLKRTSRLLVDAPQTKQQLPHPSSIPYLPTPLNMGVILRLRRSTFKSVSKRSDNSIFLERDSAKERESGFGIESQSSIDQIDQFSQLEASSTASSSKIQLPGSSRLEELGYPKGSIDSLIVTTKAQHTLSALRPLLPLITSATTIVLLQNGQGVLDLLLERLFTDPLKRPHFILASTTHGAWMKNKLSCVHAAFGKIDFGVVPNRSLGRGYERLMKPQLVEDDELRNGPAGEMQEEGLRRAPSDYDQLLLRRDTKAPARTIQPPPSLDISAIPNNPSTQTLLNTMSMLLNLPLSVTWQPIRKFQMLSLKKLVVNACINPVTALVECRNGDLFASKYAEATIRDVCKEISEILQALAQDAYLQEEERRRSQDEPTDGNHSEDGVAASASALDWDSMNKSDFLLASNNAIGDDEMIIPVLDSSLRSGALFQEVQRVIRLTAPNYSSMFQDVKNNASSTEIQYINGYFSRLGKSLGIPTPVNDLLINLIQLKTNRTTSGFKKSKL